MTEFVDATDWAGISFEDIDGVVVEERPAETPPGARTAPCQAPVLALNAAREQWAAHDLDRYAYRVTATSTWVGSVDVGEVLVWDGAVTEVLPPELTPDSLFYPPRFGVRYGTIERLFDVVESHPVPWVIATYDVERGFPKSFSFNDPSWFDEEWGFRIDDFRILDSAPDPAPPRQNRHDDDSLEIERWLPWKIAVVDAVIHPASGVYHRDWGWRHTVDVTTLVYAAPGADPIAAGPIEVIDRVGFSAPRALLHSAGDSARLMLVPGSEDHWEVFAVLELTPEGLRLDGPLARRGYSEEVRYLCHYPRSEVPSDPPPERDAKAEFELLLRWLDERGPVDPGGAWGASNAEALRRVCEEA